MKYSKLLLSLAAVCAFTTATAESCHWPTDGATSAKTSLPCFFKPTPTLTSLIYFDVPSVGNYKCTITNNSTAAVAPIRVYAGGSAQFDNKQVTTTEASTSTVPVAVALSNNPNTSGSGLQIKFDLNLTNTLLKPTDVKVVCAEATAPAPGRTAADRLR